MKKLGKGAAGALAEREQPRTKGLVLAPPNPLPSPPPFYQGQLHVQVHQGPFLPLEAGAQHLGELRVNGAFPGLHRQPDPIKSHALRKVYSHPGVLQAPHFPVGPEVALEAGESLGTAPLSPGPEAPCAQRADVGLQQLSLPQPGPQGAWVHQDPNLTISRKC